MLRSLSHFNTNRRKPKYLMKPTRNEIDYAVGPFRSQHVAPVCKKKPAASTNQDWTRISIIMCHDTVVKSDNRSGSFSFFFLQQFKLMLSTVSSFFDNCGTPTSVNSMSRIFMLLLFSIRGTLRVHAYSGNLCFQWIFIFANSHSDIPTGHFNCFDVNANWCNFTIQNFCWT